MTPIQKIYHHEACAICRDDYRKDESNECLLLKCGHVFHESCIRECFTQSFNCPSCRAPISMRPKVKDIKKEVVQAGLKGAKDATLIMMAIIAYKIAELGVGGFLYISIHHQLPVLENNIDAKGIEQRIPSGLDQPEAYAKLGLGLIAIVGGVSAFRMLKSLIENRSHNAHIDQIVDEVQTIKYQPKED